MQRLWLVVGFQGKKDLENILALDLFQSNGNRYHERKWRQIKWNKARLGKKLTYCTPNLFGSIFFEASFWFLKTLSFTCQYIFPALLRKFCIKSEHLGTDFAYEMTKYKWNKNYCVAYRKTDPSFSKGKKWHFVHWTSPYLQKVNNILDEFSNRRRTI